LLARILKSLAAVLIGNAIYFLAVMPMMPPRGRHTPFRLDLGLLIDFWICVAVYGALEIAWRWKDGSG